MIAAMIDVLIMQCDSINHCQGNKFKKKQMRNIYFTASSLEGRGCPCFINVTQFFNASRSSLIHLYVFIESVHVTPHDVVTSTSTTRSCVFIIFA